MNQDVLLVNFHAVEEVVGECQYTRQYLEVLGLINAHHPFSRNLILLLLDQSERRQLLSSLPNLMDVFNVTKSQRTVRIVLARAANFITTTLQHVGLRVPKGSGVVNSNLCRAVFTAVADANILKHLLVFSTSAKEPSAWLRTPPYRDTCGLIEVRQGRQAVLRAEVSTT